MYNKQVSCPNYGWTRNYDTKRDTFKIAEYMFCPKCQTELTEEDYTPNI